MSGNLLDPIRPQEWHFRQSVDYSVSCNYAVLDIASRRREEFLFNRWRMAENAIERGSRGHLDGAAQVGRRRRGRPGRAAEGPRDARRAGLRAALGPSGLPHRRRLRQHLDPQWGGGGAGDAGLHGRRERLSGGFAGGAVRPGQPTARARYVRAAGPSERHRRAGREPHPTLRRGGLHPGVPDGRGFRPGTRRAGCADRAGEGRAGTARR